jgi:lipoprotein-releasing system permease protein
MIGRIAQRFAQSLRGDGFSRFSTIVSIASVALGCMALIVSMSILKGYEDAIERTALQFTADIEIKPRFGGLLSSPELLAREVRQNPAVTAVDHVIAREALIRSTSGIDGVMLVGMSTDRLNKLMAPLIVHGESGVHQNEVMIGSGLAARLHAGVGDTLLVYSSDEQRESPRVFRSRIGAIIRCGMTSYDESVVIYHRTMLAQHLRVDSSAASSLLITSRDRTSLAAQQRALQQELGPEVMVFTYKDAFATVSTWIELQREPIPIILGLISLVAGLTMISTLLIAVVEKARSIAILLTLGMSPIRAGLIFVVRAVVISTLGAAIGLLVALALLGIQHIWHPITLDGALYYVSELPVSFPLMPMIIVPLSSIALALIVGLVPMVVAMRVRPATALRFD